MQTKSKLTIAIALVTMSFGSLSFAAGNNGRAPVARPPGIAPAKLLRTHITVQKARYSALRAVETATGERLRYGRSKAKVSQKGIFENGDLLLLVKWQPEVMTAGGPESWQQNTRTVYKKARYVRTSNGANWNLESNVLNDGRLTQLGILTQAEGLNRAQNVSDRSHYAKFKGPMDFVGWTKKGEGMIYRQGNGQIQILDGKWGVSADIAIDRVVNAQGRGETTLQLPSAGGASNWALTKYVAN
jgi:hypothetical protein